MQVVTCGARSVAKNPKEADARANEAKAMDWLVFWSTEALICLEIKRTMKVQQKCISPSILPVCDIFFVFNPACDDDSKLILFQMVLFNHQPILFAVVEGMGRESHGTQSEPWWADPVGIRDEWKRLAPWTNEQCSKPLLIDDFRIFRGFYYQVYWGL